MDGQGRRRQENSRPFSSRLCPVGRALSPGDIPRHLRQHTRIIAITAVLWSLGIVAFAYLLNVAGQVYRGLLYLYAIEGAVPGPFDAEQMNAAWKMKPGGKPAV